MKPLPMKPDIWRLKLPVLQSGGEAQTRRLESGLREINKEPDRYTYLGPNTLGEYCFEFDLRDGTTTIKYVKPRYHEGEIAYVPEAIKRIPKVFDEVTGYHTEAVYASDNALVSGVSWVWKLNTLPGRFLPAALARWFVQIVGPPAPQRVQEITEDDAKAEGVNGQYQGVTSYRENFVTAWDAAYPRHPFSSNPWEMTYRFKLVERPEGVTCQES